MASSISAGTTSGTALVHTADTTGALELKTNNGTVAVTIDTSQRTAFVAGTAALPAITTTGDTNTGIFFPAADTIAFSEGGAEAMRIDSSGNVGIGMTPTNFGNGYTVLQVANATNGGMLYLTNTSNAGGRIYGNAAGITYDAFSTTYHAFNTNSSERMRIDSDGRVLVGGTGPIVYSKLLSQFDGISNYGIVANDTSNGSNIGFMAFAINGNSTSGSIGTILRNGSANSVLYNTTSDQRLKENITEADAALGIVEKIKVRKYDWIEGKQHEDHGFIAQELAEAVNGVVSKGKTEDDMWAVDYGKLTPLLCKAIQEQQALITQQAAAIEALTTRITALEGTPA